MFDIGFWEMLLLCALGLIILGPSRLPEVALKIGTYLGKARSMVSSFSRQMRREIELTPNRPMSPKDSKPDPDKD
ncbi:MAG: Sec-independent protein translocase protein TatB [Methylococcales bacterium]|jgi:sec-independent protein translocase protein TatB